MVNDVLYNVRWVARIQLFLGAYAYARCALWIPKVSKWSIEFLVNKFSGSVLCCILWNKSWMFWWVEQTKNKPLSKHTKKHRKGNEQNQIEKKNAKQIEEKKTNRNEANLFREEEKNHSNLIQEMKWNL